MRSRRRRGPVASTPRGGRVASPRRRRAPESPDAGASPRAHLLELLHAREPRGRAAVAVVALVHVDFHHVAAALAPRPFFSNSPYTDFNFNVSGVWAALPQLQYVADPLGRLLYWAERVEAVATGIAEALSSPEAFEKVIVVKVSELLEILRDHPLDLVRTGTDMLKGLGDVAFAQITIMVDKIFDFLETLPERLSGIAEFIARIGSSLVEKLGIEKALEKIEAALESKALCDLVAQLTRFVNIANTVVEGFVPEGDLKDKLRDILDRAAMVGRLHIVVRA